MYTKDKLRVALIGCGTISDNHMLAIGLVPDTEVVALCDTVRERAEELGAKRAPDAKVYTDWMQMLDEAAPDVVHIATPHYLHRPMAIEALKRDMHVFLEKPMGITAEDLDALLDAEKKSKGKITVSFQNRFNETTLAAKAIADEDGGALSGFGSLFWWRDEKYYTESGWRGKMATEGGGVMINQAIHTIDLLCYFLGKPQKISAITANHHLKGVIDVEDTAAGVITFDNGKTCNFSATTSFQGFGFDSTSVGFRTKNHRIEIIGRRLYVDGSEVDVPKSDVILGKECYGLGHPPLVSKFYEAIRTGGDVPISLETAQYAVRILLAAYKSFGNEVDVF